MAPNQNSSHQSPGFRPMQVAGWAARAAVVALIALITLSATDGKERSRQERKSARPTASRSIPGLLPGEMSALSTDTVGLPFIDSMENGANGWLADGFMHQRRDPQRLTVLTPTIYPNMVLLPDSGRLPVAHSGRTVWWYGEDTTGTFIGSDFDPNQETLSGGTSQEANTGSLISPPIRLTGVDFALMAFSTWWEIEGVNSDAFDMMYIEVSTDGGISFSSLGDGKLNPVNDPSGESWKPYSSGGLGQRGVWVQQLFDLSPYLGQTVLIRFRFDTVDDKYNGFRGWFIDDFIVAGIASPAPSIKSVSPPTSVADGLVTLSGSGFVNGAQLSLMDSLRQSFTVPSTVLSLGSLMFTVPFVTPGPYSITVTNPDNKSVTLQNGLRVTTNPPPTLESITPDSTIGGVSVPVTITGFNLLQGITATIGGRLLKNPVLVNSSTLQGDSPDTLSVGAYNVKVTNVDGQFDQLVLAFRSLAPTTEIQVTTIGDTTAGTSLNLSITPPSVFPSIGGWLYFREGGTRVFDSIGVTLNGGVFRGQIPISASNLRGVEYYIRLLGASGGSITYPPQNPINNPAILRVRVPIAASPFSLPPAKYRMISIPLDLQETDSATSLISEFGTYDPERWRLFHWENGSNVEYPNIRAQFVPGVSFWLITRTNAPLVAKDGISVRSVPTVISLLPGWNQIANPFAFGVAWSDVTYPAPAATVRGPYRFDGTAYFLDTSVLIPWEGAFVWNDSTRPIPLIIPALEAPQSLITKSASASPMMPEGQYVLQLSATVPGTSLHDTQNFIGLREDAVDGRDQYDYPKPPPITDGVRVAIRNPKGDYMIDFKPASGSGQQWELSVHSSNQQVPVALTLHSEGSLPSGFDRYIFDLDNQTSVQPTDGVLRVTVPSREAARSFLIMLGTKEYAEQHSAGISLIPPVFQLDQNYPNPFNPTTTIRYQIPQRTEVMLEIFDLLGQKVRTLVDEVESPGTHVATWNATSDAGTAVASGVYFYRLSASGSTALRKLLIIR